MQTETGYNEGWTEIQNHLGFVELRITFQDTPIACNFLLHFYLNLNITILSFHLLQINQKGMTLLKEQQ
jgi:hypothetical protein